MLNKYMNINKEFDEFMLKEYGKWKIGRVEAKQFINTKLKEIAEEVVGEFCCDEEYINKKIIKIFNKHGIDI